MNPFDEHAQAMTRRHFFRQGALGLGTAALASLLPEPRPAPRPPAASAACRACRTSPRRPSGSSTCS